ncbi:hypothetical protein OAQ99_02940 [Candidatus Kapabacteria bacterium]|nr:hypothetical protein [Candidatus Kapabacteria bacterium]
MKKILSLIAIVVLASQITFAGMADKILDKALTQMGGKEKLAGITSSVVTFKSVSTMSPDTSESSVWYKDNSFALDGTLMGKELGLIWNGKEGWMKGEILQAPNWAPLSQMMMQQMSQFIFQKEILYCLVRGVDETDTLSFAGMEEMNGVKMKTVKIKGAVKPQTPSTEMLVKVGIKDNLIHQYILTYDLSAYGQPNQVVTIDCGDYKEISGVMIPHNVVIDQGGQKAELMYQSVKINTEVSDSKFANPMPKTK